MLCRETFLLLILMALELPINSQSLFPPLGDFVALLQYAVVQKKKRDELPVVFFYFCRAIFLWVKMDLAYWLNTCLSIMFFFTSPRVFWKRIEGANQICSAPKSTASRRKVQSTCAIHASARSEKSQKRRRQITRLKCSRAQSGHKWLSAGVLNVKYSGLDSCRSAGRASRLRGPIWLVHHLGRRPPNPLHPHRLARNPFRFPLARRAEKSWCDRQTA